MAEGHLHSERQDVSCASGETKSELLPPEENVSGSHFADQFDRGVNDCSQGDSPVVSVISMKSEDSMPRYIDFEGGLENTRVELDSPDSLTSSSFGNALKTPDEAYSDPTIEDGDIRCDVCPKRAFKSCLTCVASYCELHVKQHYTAPALQRHRLVKATEDLEQRLCQRHRRELELYCRTDQTEICMKCMAKEHNGHDITDLQEYQEMQRNKNSAIPPPGPIEFTSVNSDSVCLCWGSPEGLTRPHTFRVSWIGEDRGEHLDVEDLKLNVQQLHAGQKYKFTVATLSDDGRQSPYVSAFVQTDIAPPASLTVGVDLTSVSVMWTKPAGVDQATYLLTLCSDGRTLQTISTKSFQHDFCALAFEREYFIAVSTALKLGQSKPISKSIRTSIPVPERLTVVSVTSTSADFSWSLHQGMKKIPHSFLISYVNEGTEPRTICTDSFSTTLTGLQPDTQYTVSICCELRDGKRSQITSTIIQTAVPPPGPIEFTSVNPDSVCLCWGPPEGLAGPHRFRVSWMGEGRRQHLEVQELEVHVQKLTPAQEYNFTVVTLSDNGRYSTHVSGKVHTGIPVPEKLTLVSVTPTSANLSWSLHQGMEQISHSFLISYHSEGPEPQTISTESCSTTLTGLKPGTQYTISVCCKVRDGRSQNSATIIQTAIPPPGPIEFTSVNPDSVCLCWGPPEGLTGPHRFRVTWIGEGRREHLEVPDLKLHVQRLTPAQEYTFTVTTLSDDGRCSTRMSGKVHTGSFKPEGLFVSDLNEESYAKGDWRADLCWSLPHGADRCLHRFKITYQSGTGPNTITKTTTADSCSTTLINLQSETEYTARVSTVLQDGRESDPASVTFHTSERRILLLGKSGEGKSSTGNTILGEKVFTVNGCQDSVTGQCETQSRIINGRKYTVTDTPGFFDTVRSEEKLIPEIAKCIFDSAPGPHAFIIVMRVGRFTKQEQEVLEKIKEIFAEDTFKHALVVFTHGRELHNQTVEQFVEKSGSTDSSVQRKTSLRRFVEQCNGHCHAIDNEHWKQTEGESGNRTQLQKLFDTIEDMVQLNGCYSNDFSLLVVKAIQREMEKMMEHERGLTDREIREKAKSRVEWRVLMNKGAATFAALFYAAFSLQKFSSCVDRAAATTSGPKEAIKEYYRLVKILKE